LRWGTAFEGMCFGGVSPCLCTHLGIVRLILTDGSDGAEENPLRILVKMNAVPKVRLELDQMIRLTNCEVRKAWVKPDNSLPEAHLVTNLCGLELGSTFRRQSGRGSNVSGWAGPFRGLAR
jgi:hypothetical protein